ncbi:MAG: hypothetical protein OXF88_19480 [Rhodobacteraceae bacterium]|nr:hypothetical protein [Paracoccaceae bacterium]
MTGLPDDRRGKPVRFDLLRRSGSCLPGYSVMLSTLSRHDVSRSLLPSARAVTTRAKRRSIVVSTDAPA